MKTTRWTKRPQHAPREVRGPWEGITYPMKSGLQVRVVVNSKRKAKTFRYADYRGDVLATHRAAQRWRMEQLKGKQFKVRSRGPQPTTRRRRADGVIEHRITVPCQTADGVPTRVTFLASCQAVSPKPKSRKGYSIFRVPRKGLGSCQPRRQAIRGLAALALGLGGIRRSAAQAPIVLNDYCDGGLYDLTAALRDGPVTMLAQDYPCLPVRFGSRAVATGVAFRTRLLFEGSGAAFAPAAPDQPTDNWRFEDFDVQCEAKGSTVQHAFALLSCRRGFLRRVIVSDFGGTGVLVYGQRAAFVGEGAPSLSSPCGWVGEEWQCGGVRAPSDATMNVVEDVNVRRCWLGYHLGGMPAPEGVPRVKGATANMNSLVRPIASNCGSDGIMIWQGAANHIVKPILGQNGRNGLSVAWYGNLVEAAVLERNAGWGVQLFTQHKETRDNYFPYVHNGGSNGLGLSNVPLTTPA